jgi:hypothetical protein
MFGQDWIDYYNQHAQDEPLTPLAPMMPPPPPPTDGGLQFHPGALYTPPEEYQEPPVSPYYDPSQPMQRASMGALPFGLGPMGGQSSGGGLLSDLLGGGEQSTGGKDWGSMLMALGGGIAGNAHQGWGAGLGQGFQNAAVANMKSKEAAREEAYRQQVLDLKRQELGAAPKGTDDMREYEMARSQGYKGTFWDYMNDLRRSGASSVQVGSPEFGTIPPGKMLKKNPDGSYQLESIPDPQAEEEERLRQEAIASDAAEKSDIMLDAIEGIKEARKDKMPTVGSSSRIIAAAPLVGSETGAGKIRSYVGTLQSGVALEKIKAMKEQSSTGATGFGALNKEELQLLIDDFGKLDPDGNSEVFDKTLANIERRWKRVKADAIKNISPERWEQLGLDDVFGPRDGEVPTIPDSGNVVRKRYNPATGKIE